MRIQNLRIKLTAPLIICASKADREELHRMDGALIDADIITDDARIIYGTTLLAKARMTAIALLAIWDQND